MSRKRRGLRVFLPLLIIFMTVMASALVVQAAPQNTRGRIAIDLGTFEKAAKNGKGSHGLDKDGSEYQLHYLNKMISNHNNDGVTYRSTSTYDMTDVTKLEFYAYTMTDDSHKFMVYCTSNKDTHYQGRDYDSVTDSMYKEDENIIVDGEVYMFSPFSYSIGIENWQRDFFRRTISITDSYESRYVFVGLSHGFAWQDATVHFDNSTYSGEEHGSIALLLKEHKVKLLAPQAPFTRINSDNKSEDILAFTNLTMKLNDGGSYAPNKEGSIYRGEEIVLTYEYIEPYCVKLTGYNIYSDANRSKLLLHINANETVGGKAGTASCTIKYDSNLIQKIEKANGIDLGNFCIEPVFERISTDIVVAENASNADGVKVVKDGSNSKKYKIYDSKSSSKDIIGWLELNNASALQDYLQVEYTPNDAYNGEHGVGKVYLKYCDTRSQINTTTDTAWFRPSAGLLDYNELIEDKCIGIEVYIIGRPILTLKDKTVTYSGDRVEVDKAAVSYKLPANGEVPKHLNDIVYTYYSDAECKKKMDAAPVDAGTYYVQASMEGDDNYVDSKSNVAKIVINKATPKVVRAIGTSITYPAPLSKSSFTGTGSSVEVHTVKGQKMTGGTMEWIDDTQVLPAGYQSAKIRYTPSETYANNYTIYEDTDKTTGKVTVKAASLTVDYQEGTFDYTGNTYPMQTAKVYLKGTTTEVTDVAVNYTYHTDSSCGNSSKLPEAPKNAGTYYAKASVPSGGNYNGASAKTKIAVNPVNASLLQVPLKNVSNEYFVYLKGIIADLPNGQIKLTVTSNGTSKELLADIQKDETSGKVFAKFNYDEVTEKVADGETFTVKATYAPDADKVQNYIISDSTMTFENGVFAKVEEITLNYGEAASNTKVSRWNYDFFEATYKDLDNVTLIWPFVANGSEVVEVTPDEPTSLEGGYKLKAKNAGCTYVLGFLKDEKDSMDVKQYYLLYDITVEPAKTNVVLHSKEFDFDGIAKEIDPATVIANDVNGISTNITKDSVISYHYYTDAECSQELEELPVEAGTYYVVARTVAKGNYKAGESAPVTLTIKPVAPLMSMEDDTVTYDSKPHTLTAVVEPTVKVYESKNPEDENSEEYVLVKEYPVTGKVTYKYVNEDGETVDKPVNVGVYTVTATLEADGNYLGDETTATLIIKKATVVIIPDPDPDPEDNVVYISLSGIEKVYDGQKTPVKADIKTSDEDLKASLESEITYEYLRRGGSLDEITTEPPVNAGLYYARAVIDGNGNFEPLCSEIVLVWIKKAQPAVVIPGATIVEYTGEAVTVDSAVVTVGEQEMTDSFEVTYKYYQGLLFGKQEIDPPTEPGIYFAKAFVAEQENYEAAESDYHIITITRKEEPSLPDDDDDEEADDDVVNPGGGDSNDEHVPNTGDNQMTIWYLAALATSTFLLISKKRRSVDEQ